MPPVHLVAILTEVSPVQSLGPVAYWSFTLLGVFVFGVSGGLAAARARLDIFGVVVLAAAVGVAGGTARDVLLGIRPTGLFDWRVVLCVVAAGLVAFFFRSQLVSWKLSIDTFDAIGLSVFCVIGTGVALVHHSGPVAAVILGTVTAVGGGVTRDILLRRVPEILRQDLYAVPAILGSLVVVLGYELGQDSWPWYLLGGVVCFVVRMAGLIFNLNLPRAKLPEDDEKD
jgi:uncharacterized membrane protein YeiH